MKKIDKKFEQKSLIILGILLLFSWAGLNYPVVGRNGVWLEHTPISMAILSISSGIFLTFQFIKLSKAAFDSIFEAIFFYFMIGIFNSLLLTGIFLFINGVFDFHSHQSHKTTILKREISRGKYGPYYYFYVNDWIPNSANSVRLSVDGVIYQSFDIGGSRSVGTQVTVVTSQGFLGYERLIDAR